MQVFKNQKKYEDYIRVIVNSMTSDTFEFLNGFEHERGLKYLTRIKDEKLRKKVIKTLDFIDKDMTEVPRQDETYRKLSYFLKAGILYGEYFEYTKDLTPEAISTLLTDNVFSMNNEMTINYITILANNELLTYIRKNFKPGEKDEIMFAITGHYDKEPFDVENKKQLLEFQKNIILKLEEDKEKYINEVPTFADLAEEVWKSIDESERLKR